MIDLVKGKAIYFEGEKGTEIVEKDIPQEYEEICREKKLELLGALAEVDPAVEEYYINEDINIPVDILKKSIRESTLSLKFCPVFLGSAYKNKGI